MSELLLIYTAYVLAAPTTFPLDHDGFMPFQENYILWKCIGFAGIGTDPQPPDPPLRSFSRSFASLPGASR